MTAASMTASTMADNSLSGAKTGVLPAIIGALGAAIGLHLLAPIFATFSIPISVLGIVLGLHNRNLEAVAAGSLAVAVAMVAPLNSDMFWAGFGIVGSAVTAG